ncbi:MAG: ABC transporter permease [Candidatus Humimicrobiaceae bacterium]
MSVNGVWAIIYRDLTREKKHITRSLIGMILSPLLFFLAFGWGLGSSTNIDGHPYGLYMLAGLIAMNGMNTAFSIGTTINVERFYWRTFEEFQVAPISNIDIAAGKICFGIIKGIIGSLLIYLIGLIFGVVLKFNIIFFLSVFLNCFMFSALALWIALVVKTHQQQGDFNSFIMTPMAFLAGTFFPIDRFPVVFKVFSMIFPLTHSVNCIRASALGTTYPIYSLITIAGYTILFLFFATKSVKDLSL